MGDYLKSGRQAIRLLYYIIIGLSVTKALTNLFIVNNSFILPDPERIQLFIIYFSFLIRFFLGAYRVLAYDIDIETNHTKIVIDMIGFISQALTFFVFSLCFFDASLTHFIVFLICAIDLVWLILLKLFANASDSTTIQWFVHNILMIVFISLNYYFGQNIFYLFVISSVAFFIDLFFNREFYFSLKNFKGLKIFVFCMDQSFDMTIAEQKSKIERIKNSIISKGHLPYIPTSILTQQFDNQFLDVDQKWLENSDALYVYTKSENEKIFSLINTKSLKIFSNPDQIPSCDGHKIFKI